MRRYLLVLPFLVACAREEAPPADSAAAAMPPAITEADVAGTWTGTATPEAPDTGTVNFTITCSGGSCHSVVSNAPTDTVHSTYVLAADSSTGTSSPYKDAQAGGAMVVDHWVARVTGTQVTGHGWVTLSEKPDSVVGRYRFTGSKSP
jgi:hypothetical protein